MTITTAKILEKYSVIIDPPIAVEGGAIGGGTVEIDYFPNGRTGARAALYGFKAKKDGTVGLAPLSVWRTLGFGRAQAAWLLSHLDPNSDLAAAIASADKG